VRYDAPTQRLYINSSQYFAPVTQEVWQTRIGGYPVCDKWLKERTERKLSLDEVRTFCRVLTALYHTVRLQQRIDAVFLKECVPSHR
jgi:hypothetical protein